MKKTLTLSFLFLVFAEFVYNISAYVIKFGLSRNLSIDEYGKYSVVISFTTMLIVLVGRGVPTAMNKRISEQGSNWGKILAIKKISEKLQTYIILSITVLFFLMAPVVAHFFKDESLTNLFRLSSLLIPTFALSSFHVAYFNGLRAFGAMTTLKIFRGIFRGIFIILGAYFYGITGAIVGAIIAPFSVYLVAIVFDKFVVKKPTDIKISKYPYKNILSYAYKFLAFLFFYEFFTRVDLYLIKFFLHSDKLTGLYDAALTTALVPYFGVFALTFVLFPTMSKLSATKESEKIKKLLTRVLVFLVISLGASSLILLFFSDYIINVLFGVKFEEAYSLVPLMLGGTFFGTIFYIFASVLNGSGHTKITSSIVAIALLFSIALNSIFLPTHGLCASALIFSITSTFMGVSVLFFVYLKFFQSKA